MPIRVLAGLLAAALSGSAAAESFDINFGDDRIQAAYTGTARTAEYEFRFMDNDERDNWVASAGLLVSGPRTNVEAGLGGKLYLLSVSNEEIYGLGLGGQIRAFLGNGPFAVSGSLFYAPDALTGGDGEDFWEATARLELEVVPDGASIYVGYRKVRATLQGGADATVDSGGHIGVQLRF